MRSPYEARPSNLSKHSFRGRQGVRPCFGPGENHLDASQTPHVQAMRRMPTIILAFTPQLYLRRPVQWGLGFLALLIGSAHCAIAQPMLDYESVSLINLIATPERYDNKKVVAAGWITLELENMSLCIAKEVPSGKECVWVELDDETRNHQAFEKRLNQWRQHNGKLVVVHGVFGKANQGHLGGWSGALQKIERISALPRKRATAQ